MRLTTLKELIYLHKVHVNPLVGSNKRWCNNTFSEWIICGEFVGQKLVNKLRALRWLARSRARRKKTALQMAECEEVTAREIIDVRDNSAVRAA